MKSIVVRVLLASLATIAVSRSVHAQDSSEQYGTLGASEPEIRPASEPGRLTLATGATMDNSISVLGIFSYFYGGGGVGIGARYQKEIVPQGFIHHPRIHDELGIEGSFEYIHYGSLVGYDYNQFQILAGVVWNVWLTPQFGVYPKAGLGVSFGSFSGDGVTPTGYGGLVVFGAAGILYRLEPVTLRAEVGSGSIQLGVSMNL